MRECLEVVWCFHGELFRHSGDGFVTLRVEGGFQSFIGSVEASHALSILKFVLETSMPDSVTSTPTE